MILAKYSNKKSSGFAWIGEIPNHWEILPVKRWFSTKSGGTPNTGQRDAYYVETNGYPWIRTTDLNNSELHTFEVMISEEGLRNSACEILPVNSILIAMYGGDGTVGKNALLKFPSTINQAICALLPNPLFHPSYALRYFQFYRPYWMIGAESSRKDPNISQWLVRNTPIVCPPIDEQIKIVEFLDKEVEKIDRLLVEMEKAVDLLKFKRSATIFHAISKGIKHSKQYKDSGIRWLGSIPKHWKAIRIKWVAKLESGHTPNKKLEENWVDCTIPWVSLNDTQYLKENDYINETSVLISKVGIENSSARILPSRTVVFSRDATIGRCAITSQPMAVSQHFIAWLCGDQVLPEYLLFALRSMESELERLSMGATVKTIGMEDVKSLTIPLPPIEEQEEIVSYIFSETKKIDSLLAEFHMLSHILIEKRTASITAAVTGKIDVRGLD